MVAKPVWNFEHLVLNVEVLRAGADQKQKRTLKSHNEMYLELHFLELEASEIVW